MKSSIFKHAAVVRCRALAPPSVCILLTKATDHHIQCRQERISVYRREFLFRYVQVCSGMFRYVQAHFRRKDMKKRHEEKT